MKQKIALLLIICLGIFFNSIAQAPTISSFSPSIASVGSLVTITGTNLSNPTAITIGSVAAIPVSNSGTQLVAMVMPGATTGAILVTNASGSTTSNNNLVITSAQLPNTQQGSKMVGTGNVGAARQGSSIAISADGNTAIIGGSGDNSNIGAAWIYVKSGGIWAQQGNKLVGTGAVGTARQGASVAISADGNTALVGGYTDNSNAGAVWIFVRNGSTWSQQGTKLVGTGATGAAYQGYSVALSADGNTALVGGINDNYASGVSDGAVWVFIRNDTNWSQQGNKLVGSGASTPAVQGVSVSLSADGNIAAIGGSYDSTNKGAVWIFTRSGGIWSQQGSKLIGNNRNNSGYGQGQSVSLSADGNTLIMGATNGSVWVFTQSGGVWTQQGDKLNVPLLNSNSSSGNFGYSVAIAADGNSFVVGAYTHKDITLVNSQGAAWIFKRSGNAWSEYSKLLGTSGVGGSQQGFSVAISADASTAMIGGNLDNSNNGAFWAFTYATSSVASIKSFSPLSGVAGSTVTINGRNFGSTTSSNLVYFGTIKATITTATDSSLTVIVPSGATHSKLTVYNTVTSTMAESRAYFTTSFSPSNPSIVASDYASRIEFALGTGPSDIKIADFDGDGKVDVVSSNRTAGTVSVLRNTSTLNNINFATKADFAVLASPAKVYLQDIDGDGKVDISTISATGISILKNTSTLGNISFATKQDITLTSSSYTNLVFADIDGDGKLDAIVATNSTKILFFRNISSSGNISFASSIGLNVGLNSTALDPNVTSFVIADIDGDGKQDIFINATDLSVLKPVFYYFKNTSVPGIFNFAKISGLYSSITTIADLGVSADLNNDGIPEIIFADGSTAFKISQSQNGVQPLTSGTITFKSFVKVPNSGTTTKTPGIADLNGDGKPDLIGWGSNNTLFSIFQNTAINDSIQFGNSFTVSGGASLTPTAVMAADFDGDDKPDIVCINTTGAKLAVLRSNVQGVASASVSVTGSLNNFSTCYGSASASQFFDIEGANLTDSLVINTPNGVEISTNSNGSYSNRISFAHNNGAVAITRIYIRIASSATTNITDSIVLSSAGGTLQTLPITANIRFSTASINNISICPNALPYTWNGLSFNGDGSQTAYLTNSVGCDSAATLNLTVKANYTITATAGSNGSISNSGASTICEGDNSAIYTITPNAGYHITDVLVDGVSQGAVTTYTFYNVIANHTIAVSFALSCTPSTSDISQTACVSYNWNGTTYTASGDYTSHFTNSCGLDSAATLHLTINTATSSTQTVNICNNQLPYSWNGLTFNTPGTQTKTGLTNSKGCDSSATLTLNINTLATPSISINSTASNVCAGTLVKFAATPANGGTTPSYQWRINGVNTGANKDSFITTSLSNGDSVICLLISQSACSTSSTVSSNVIRMTVNPNPEIGLSSGGNICGINGTLSVYNTNTLFGGVWTSSNTNIATVSTAPNAAGGLATGVSKGTVILTYTKTNIHGCSVSASSIVNVIDPIISGPAIICKGNTAQLSVNETGGYWVSNNNKATVSTTGLLTAANAGNANISYVLGGCTNVNTYTPTVVAAPAAPTIGYAVGSINPQQGAGSSYCNNRTFALVGSPAGGIWSSSNTNVMTVTSGGVATTVGLGNGSVVYTYTNIAGCSSSRSIVGNVVGCAARGTISNEQLAMSSDFTIYPNPAKTFISLNVETLTGKGSIVVTDLYGKTVKNQPLSIGTNTIDIANLSKGMYFVSTITNEGKTTKKLVVE